MRFLPATAVVLAAIVGGAAGAPSPSAPPPGPMAPPVQEVGGDTVDGLPLIYYTSQINQQQVYIDQMKAALAALQARVWTLEHPTPAPAPAAAKAAKP